MSASTGGRSADAVRQGLAASERNLNVIGLACRPDWRIAAGNTRIVVFATLCCLWSVTFMAATAALERVAGAVERRLLADLCR